MSKIKQASQSLTNNTLDPSLVSRGITPVDALAAFTSIMAAENTPDSTTKNDGDNKSQESSEDQVGAVRAKESTKESSNSEGDGKSEKVKSTESEEKELQEISDHQVSLQALAKQLNVILDTAAETSIVNQVARPVMVTTTQGAPQLSDLQKAIQDIPQDLLRKVDVKSLSQQLQKIIPAKPEMHVSAPDSDLNSQMISTQDEVQAQTLLDAQALIDAQNLIEGQVKDIALKNPHVSPGQDLWSQTLAQDQVNEVVPAWTDEDIKADLLQASEEEGITLNVVSVDLYRDVRLEDREIVLKHFGSQDQSLPTFSGDSDKLPLALDTTGLPKTQTAFNPINGLMTMPTPPPVFNSSAEVKPHVAAIAKPLAIKVEQIMFEMAKNGRDGVTRIQLNPETLGRIDIRFEMKEKSIRAELITDQALTKDLIEKYIPQIKAAFATDHFSFSHFSARHDQSHFAAATQELAERHAGSYSKSGRRDFEGQFDKTQSGDGVLAGVASKNQIRPDSLVNVTV